MEQKYTYILANKEWNFKRFRYEMSIFRMQYVVRNMIALAMKEFRQIINI